MNVSLTDKGRDAVIQAMLVAREIVDQIMSLISEDGAFFLEKSLSALKHNAYCGLKFIAKPA